MNLVNGYLALNLLMVIAILAFGFKAIDTTFADKAVAQKKRLFLITGLLAWHLYIYGVSYSGVLQTYELPPRFVIFLVGPAFIFTGVFFYTNRNNKWVVNVPDSWLTFVQSFRILVETLFVYSVAAEILHPNVTIEGYNYDMIFGFTAPIIGLLVLKNLPKQYLVMWNYLGLAVLASVIFVFVTSTYFPGIYGSNEPLMPMAFTEYPFVTVAGFLMPLAVFTHIWSLMKLRRS